MIRVHAVKSAARRNATGLHDPQTLVAQSSHPSNVLVIGGLRECEMARFRITFRNAGDENENQPSDISATRLGCTP